VKTVRVGIVGGGFAASLHVTSLRRVIGIDVRVVAVATQSGQTADNFARRNQIPDAYSDYRDLITDPSIDVVCVCVPPALHAEVVIAAARAGKHVICEKPLTGAFGADVGANGLARARAELGIVQQSVDELTAIVESTGVTFMYAENWVYAPAVSKMITLMAEARGAILDIRAEESHSGSHAIETRRRRTAGGGALLTLGSHGIGAALHLKKQEALISGSPPATVATVTAEVAALATAELPRPRGGWLVDDWEDVERWATVLLGFTDGSRATITASFAMLGGIRNLIEVYTTNAAFRGNMTPNDALLAYSPDGDLFGEEYLHEKLESRTGWISASPDEDWIRGYPQEMQDFMECVAVGREPLSDLSLASSVVEIVHASYLSAEEGRRVELASARGPRPTATSSSQR